MRKSLLLMVPFSARAACIFTFLLELRTVGPTFCVDGLIARALADKVLGICVLRGIPDVGMKKICLEPAVGGDCKLGADPQLYL